MRTLRERLKISQQIDESYPAVHHYVDYLEGIDSLPKSNVLKIWLQDGSTLIVRPSGTEPKIKFYKEEVIDNKRKELAS